MSSTDTTQPLRVLDAAATIEAMSTACVLRWWQTTVFIEVAGPDAATLLDGLCTQAVERITPETACLGLFLDAKAKIIAPAIIHRTADATWTDPRAGEDDPALTAPRILLETVPDAAESLRSHLTKYRLRARASITTTDLATIAVSGMQLPPTAELPVVANGEWSSVIDGSHPTAAWIGSHDSAAHLAGTALANQAIDAADPDAFEAARIDACVAGLHDLLPGSMPAEVGGMERAVALDAGCYLGQEPVARLHYRGRANRSLRQLEADSPVQITPIEDASDPLALHRIDAAPDSRPVGRLTTWAMRPDGTMTALAVLRREVEVGDEVRLAAGSATLRVSDSSPAG